MGDVNNSIFDFLLISLLFIYKESEKNSILESFYIRNELWKVFKLCIKGINY